MAKGRTRDTASAADRFSDAVWADVLSAVDRTYAELVDHQERLEQKNAELETMRSFLASILASVSDVLIVVSRRGAVEEVSASFPGQAARGGFAGQPVAELFDPADRDRLAAAMVRSAQGRTPETIEASLAVPGDAGPMELSISPRLTIGAG